MRYSALLALLLMAGCASAPVPAASPVEFSPGVAWVMAEDEWADEARTVFEEATAYANEIAATRPEKSWAAILDLDETVLNNVEYQIGRETLKEGFTPESWYDWTQEERATLVPGADVFIDAVNAAGGHVAFVTNRMDTEHLATEKNLAALGLLREEDFRVLLTRASPPAPGEKDGRFQLVPQMLAAQGYAGVEVIAYVGDNVGDKPKTPGNWEFFCVDQGAMYGAPCAAVPGPGR